MGASSDYADALKRYVVVGDDGLNRVRYRAWKSSEPDRRALDAYVEHLQTLPVSTLPDAERMAFWIDLPPFGPSIIVRALGVDDLTPFSGPARIRVSRPLSR